MSRNIHHIVMVCAVSLLISVMADGEETVIRKYSEDQLAASIKAQMNCRL